MATVTLANDTAFTPTGNSFRLHVSEGGTFNLFTRADAGSAWVHAGALPNGSARDVANGVPATEYKVVHSGRAGLTFVIKLTQS